MIEEKNAQLRETLIKKLVGAVTFGEIVRIVHSVASREIDHQLSILSEEEKEQMYEDLCAEKTTDLSQLSDAEA